MTVSLLSSLAKSPEASAVPKEVDLPGQQHIDFSEVFDNAPSEAAQSAALQSDEKSPATEQPAPKTPTLDSPDLETPELKVPEHRTPELKSSEHDIPEFDAPEPKPTEVNASELETPESKATELHTRLQGSPISKAPTLEEAAPETFTLEKRAPETSETHGHEASASVQNEIEGSLPIPNTRSSNREAPSATLLTHASFNAPTPTATREQNQQSEQKPNIQIDQPLLKESEARSRPLHSDTAERSIGGERQEPRAKPDAQSKLLDNNSKLGATPRDANLPTIDSKQGQTSGVEIQTHNHNNSKEQIDPSRSRKTENVSDARLTQEIAANWDETSKRRDIDRTQANIGKLAPQMTPFADTSVGGRFTDTGQPSFGETTSAPENQTNVEGMKQSAVVTTHGAQNDKNLLQSHTDTRQRIDGDQKTEDVTTKHLNVAPMSVLDRHLSRLPVTLVSKDSIVQPPNVSTPDVNDGKKAVWRNADVSQSAATASTNLVNTTPAPPPLPQVMQMNDLKVATIHSEQNGRDTSSITGRIGEDLGWDLRSPLQTPNAVQTNVLPKTDPSGAVVQQIAEALRKSPDKPIEIALSPVELGRVRMVLSASDAGITVNIFADRPDTLELLRRNIDDLGKSFSEMGYEDISFSFEQGEQTTDDSKNQHTDPTVIGPEEVAATDTPILPPRHSSTLAIAPGGIDMRL